MAESSAAARAPAPTCWGRGRLAVALLVVLAVAAALRCYHLGGKSLWLDEYFSLECSAGWARTDLRLPHDATAAPDLISLHNARPWWTIWKSVAADENHPPLYFLLLRGWRVMFGDSADALRSLSVAASMVSVALVFCIGLETGGPGVAIGAALLMALTWPQIQRAQDARPYALVTTLSLAAALALVRIEQRGATRRRAAALGIAALLMPLVHYLAFAELAAMGVYATAVLRGRARRDVLLCLGGATLAFGIIWGPNMVRQRQAMIDRTAWLSDPATIHNYDTWARLALTPVRMFLEPDAKTGAIAGIGGLALLAPLLAVQKHPRVLLWWLWMVAPVGSALFLDMWFGRSSLGNTKYTTLAEPAIYLLAAMLGASWQGGTRKWGWAIPGALVLACVLCLPNVYRSVLGERDWRPMAAMLHSAIPAGEPIALVDHSPNWPAGYFLVGVSYNLPDRQRPLLMVDGPPPEKLLENWRDAMPVGTVRRMGIVGFGDDLGKLVLPSGAKLVAGEFFASLSVVGVVDFDAGKMPANRSH
jgi:hypothetical protein